MHMYIIAIRFFIVRIKDRALHNTKLHMKYIFSYFHKWGCLTNILLSKSTIQHTEKHKISFSHQISVFYKHISSWKNLYNPAILNLQQLYLAVIFIQFEYWGLKQNKNTTVTCSIIIPLLWNYNFWMHLNAFSPYSVKKKSFSENRI